MLVQAGQRVAESCSNIKRSMTYKVQLNAHSLRFCGAVLDFLDSPFQFSFHHSHLAPIPIRALLTAFERLARHQLDALPDFQLFHRSQPRSAHSGEIRCP